MAARSKKGMKDPSPSKPYKASPLTSDPLRRPRATVLSGKKSLLDDTFFSQLAKEAAAEESDVSEADPQILLDRMKDMDDMDAEIFGGKKPKSAPAKDSGMSRSVEVEPKPEEKTTGAKRGHSAPESEQKPPPGPAGPARPFKRFSFDDVEDPLAGLLSDEDEAVAKKTPSPGTKAPQEPSPVRATAAPLPAPVRPSPAARRKDDLTFEEDTDDLMDALGFGDSPEGPQKEEGAAPRPARSKLDELLGRGTSPKLLERPQTGERKEFKLDPKYQKQPEKEDTWGTRTSPSAPTSPHWSPVLRGVIPPHVCPILRRG
ncbi:fas-binding factor 1 isoform X2 [Ascaphus truei]|uniref:fas-binding factor 1 isoform X2 n=1 Tax=Ascaphus truei TaxID=8439 RepID=UPI003F59DCB3